MTLLPVTQSQILFWTGQKMNSESPLYNVPYVFWVYGKISESVFRETIQELVNRTDVLRTVFSEEGSTVHQTVLADFKFDIEIIDFTKNGVGETVSDWINARSRKTFDLSKPLFDSVLLKIKEDEYAWFLNQHHLITDAVSSAILFELGSNIYSALLKGTLDEVPHSPSYSTYIRAENDLSNNVGREVAMNYWQKKLDEGIAPSRIYGSRKRTENTETVRLPVELGADRSNRLRALAQDPEVRMLTTDMSLFTICTAVLFSHVFRITGQEKLCIGSPIHKRTTSGFKQTIGLFVELFPLVADMSPEETFLSLLKRMRITVGEFLKYAQAGTATAEISRSFNVVFNYINTKFSNFHDFETSTEWVDPGHCDPSHHLRCHLIDFDASGDFTILFDLNKAIFSEKQIELFSGHFIALLDSFLDNPDVPIGKPRILSVQEQQELVIPKNEEVTKNSTYTVLGRLDDILSSKPNNIALEYGQESISYMELGNRVESLALLLHSKGVTEADRVGLHLYRSPDYIIGALAIMKLGAAFIPIAAGQPAERIEYIVTNSACNLIVSQTQLIKHIDHLITPMLDINTIGEIEISNNAKNTEIKIISPHIAYHLYTSGSTGKPKGVVVSQGALFNYINWGVSHYKIDENTTFPLFTSIGFDLTISSTFLPLMTGGKLVIYPEIALGPDISLMQVLGENKVNAIKLTPSHLALLQDRDLSSSVIETMIVGGEDFKSNIARSIQGTLGKAATIYNEYGPTEATVGCIVSEFDPKAHLDASVPIGKPISNMAAYILDTFGNLVPKGVPGELFLSGDSLAIGYANAEKLTQEKFADNPFVKNAKMYRTGDLVRINKTDEMEFLGRVDEQIKLNGYRIELADIEANLSDHPNIENAAVVLLNGEERIAEDEVINCAECGLPSNYPNTDFDAEGVCHLCNAFKGYKEKTDRYFKTEEELKELLSSKKGLEGDYDCLSLLSGGKDSTYILARLIDMGLRVLAFTLDNGYISDQAKANVDKIVKNLNVDHVYGQTAHMNKIFVDSLNRHQNVCNGCFKTIYTLSTKIALEKNIPFVVTGLSRGQFFETKLTEELFWDDTVDTSTIDKTILEARKLYHQEEDAVNQLLDVSMFKNESTFDKVQFVDFYRYCDVSLSEMLHFLKEKVGWERPTDTGRSTNCLINQVGIYVHKKEKGYSNYSFPYSWDVRLGHKTREETLDEINEYIDEKEVKRIMGEIGYIDVGGNNKDRPRLVGYFTGSNDLKNTALKDYLSSKLPDYMLPSMYKYIEEMPLTRNGKVDKMALRNLSISQLEMDTPYLAPSNEIEELLEGIWTEVLQLKRIGVHDNFIALGGHSLAAIRVTTRVNDELEMNFPLNKIFELPTIKEYANFIEATLTELLN